MKALNYDCLPVSLPSNRSKRFRVEFYGMPKEGTDEAPPSVGYIDLVLSEAHWDNVVGIAFKRCNSKCLGATTTKVFEVG